MQDKPEIRHCWCTTGQITANHEGDFGFHLRLNEARHRYLLVIEVFHVIEQYTEVRLVNATLLLHGLGCESDLEVGNAASLLHTQLRVVLGDRVRGVKPSDAVCRGNLWDGAAAPS